MLAICLLDRSGVDVIAVGLHRERLSRELALQMDSNVVVLVNNVLLAVGASVRVVIRRHNDNIGVDNNANGIARLEACRTKNTGRDSKSPKLVLWNLVSRVTRPLWFQGKARAKVTK